RPAKGLSRFIVDQEATAAHTLATPSLTLATSLGGVNLSLKLFDNAVYRLIHVPRALFGLDVFASARQTRLGHLLVRFHRKSHLNGHWLAQKHLKLAHFFCGVGLNSLSRYDMTKSDADIHAQ